MGLAVNCRADCCVVSVMVYLFSATLAGDGAAFYMVLGKIIAYSHRLVPMPGYERFTMIGLQGELHFAALMVLHSPEAAKLFSWPTISMAGIVLAATWPCDGMADVVSG